MHNIFGERFLGNKYPAWHKLGKVFFEALTAVEAVEQANCDFAVFKSPLMAEIHNTWFDSGKNSGTKNVPVPDKYIITREPTDDDPQFRFFGACSDQYEILDNMEIARALDVLTDRMPVETVGALSDGKILFISLDAGEVDIGKNGDTVHQYFLFSDRKDGSEKARFTFTPVRVVCQNTLVMGERQATVSAEISHLTGASQMLQLRVDILDELLKAQELSIEVLQAMASVEITNRQAAEIINAAFPLPKKSPNQMLGEGVELSDGKLAESLFAVVDKAQNRYDYMYERAEVLRDGAKELYNTINDEHTGIARTPWAAYNAVVELADWRQGRGLIEQSALYGRRAGEKVKAYNAAEKITARLAK